MGSAEEGNVIFRSKLAELAQEAVPYMFQRFRNDVLALGFRGLADVGDTRPLFKALAYGFPYVVHRELSWFADAEPEFDSRALSRSIVNSLDEYLHNTVGPGSTTHEMSAEEREDLRSIARVVLEHLQFLYETRADNEDPERLNRQESLRQVYRTILASVALTRTDAAAVSSTDAAEWEELCRIADETQRRLTMRWIGAPSEALEALGAEQERDARKVEERCTAREREARESTIAYRFGRWIRRLSSRV